MSDLVINALRRNREIAEKQGQTERVERYDARLAQLADDQRSAQKEAVEVDATDSAIDLALASGIDLSSIKGSGAGGRILKSDVEAALDEG
jgi:pyruvate/2-oxoglutarate dehydrogenase complex dihydrolipoamide acyltransferase (E2) component